MRNLIFKNSANIITTIGIIVAAWTNVLVWNYQNQGAVFVLAIIAALTDFVDGWMARKWKIESLVGASLDRWRDKLFICPLFVFFIMDIANESSLTFGLIKATLGLLLVIEMCLIITWFIGLAKKWDVSSHRAGKIKQTLYVAIVSGWLLVRFLEQKSYFESGLITRVALIILLVCAARYAILSLSGYLERYINIGKAS